jgi:hypothetical protein
VDHVQDCPLDCRLQGLHSRREDVEKNLLQQFFSSLMHVFDIEPPTHGELPSLEGIAGATLGPKPFEVNFNDRNIEAIIKTRQQL